MLHLIQLYNYVDNKELFASLFYDFKGQVDEMGYCLASAGELVNEILFNDFGFEIEDEGQLNKITEALYSGKLANVLRLAEDLCTNPIKP
jgi:hypothetical protein